MKTWLLQGVLLERVETYVCGGIFCQGYLPTGGISELTVVLQLRIHRLQL